MADEVIDVTSNDRAAPGAELVHVAPAPAPVVAMSPTTPMREWNVIVAQAETLAQSDIVPAAYRRKAPNIIAAAIAGRAYGWDAMTAMLNGHVIEGRYGVSPEAQLGLVRGAGHSVTKVAEDRGKSVTVRGRRRDSGDTLDVTWTIDDAKAARLAAKDNWQKYPAAMLWARAVSELCTQLFPDVTLGLARYTADELGADETPDSAEALPARSAPPDGWASWEACDAAHDAYRARWSEAPDAVRRKMVAYAKSSGYAAPMTKLELDELEGQLDVELSAPAEHVKVEAHDSGDATPAPPADAPAPTTGASASPAESTVGIASPAPVVDVPSDHLDDAPATGSAPTPDVALVPLGESGPATGPDLPPGPVAPTAEAPADRCSPGERARIARQLNEFYGNEKGALARHALASVVSDGRTRTTTELSSEEARWVIRAAKLLATGNLGFGVLSDDAAGETALDVLDVPPDDAVVTLLGCIPEGGDLAPAERFLSELAEYLGVPAS